jgi:predicted nucleotidyltransferase
MITLRKISEKRQEILDLAEKHRAANVRIFGSVARADNKEESDVDFLIQTKPGCSLFDLGGLLQDLRDLLGCSLI